jgi:hypothetical protein
LPTPGKKRNKRPENTKVQVDDFDQCVIRNIIHYFYATKKEVPTAAKLLPIVTEKINFPWVRKSLTRVVKSIGITWKKSNSKRRILIEKPEIVSWCHKYLVQMKRFREQGKEMFYVDESWIDSNITYSKCWQGQTEFGIQKNYNTGNRLILLHAGSENDFLHNAMLVYKAGEATGNYHGQMNGTNFEKWVHKMLAPNLPSASVIVFDNAPHHSVQVDKVPSKYAVKKRPNRMTPKKRH